MENPAFIKEKIEEIRSKLARPCTEFQTGGFRPSGERTESWIGRVFLCRLDEAKPVTDNNGNPLYPLAQFYLPALPYVPDALKHITWLTVFMGSEFPEQTTSFPNPEYPDGTIEVCSNGEGWLIREYTADDEMVEYEFEQQGVPKPFPLKPIFRPMDFPLWDGGGVPMDIADEICELDNFDDEDNPNKLGYYDDIVGDEHCYMHKFGGYPSFCQSGVSFGEGFEFMFQISSDEKACFNVVDSGSMMFARNPEGRWHLYYDFY